jgi:hypothetical protein
MKKGDGPIFSPSFKISENMEIGIGLIQKAPSLEEGLGEGEKK